MMGLLRGDELERAHRISSRAKKAAAFLRISFSCLSRAFSRRRRLSSSRSAVVRPSSRSPRSSCSRLTQLRRHDSAIESSRAIAEIDRSPWRTSANAPSRNSFGYGLGIRNTILSEPSDDDSRQVSTKAGELQARGVEGQSYPSNAPGLTFAVECVAAM